MYFRHGKLEAGLQATHPVIQISAGRSSVVLGIRYMPQHEMQQDEMVTPSSVLQRFFYTSSRQTTREHGVNECVAAPWFPSRARSRREVLLAGRIGFCVYSTLCTPTSTGMWCR